MAYTSVLKYIQVLMLLWISVSGQVGPAKINNLELSPELMFDPELTSQECLDQMQEIFTPVKLGTLSKMFLYTGHNINDIGNFDECNMNDELDYVDLIAMVGGAPVISIGICGPRSCSSNGNYDNMANMLADALKQDPRMEGKEVKSVVVVPRERNSEKLDAGAWVMIVVCIIIAIMMIAGMIVQYTSIGDLGNRLEESNENVKVEDKKNKLALLFYSFSPTANIQKLFTVKQGGDQTLSVLNGIRVLSICWVIVGHGFGFTGLAPITNFATYLDMTKESLFGVIPGGVYAVDSFFFLSGFLSFCLLTSKMYPRKGQTNIGLIYFHRYYRLIFPLVFVTGFCYWLMPYLGDGPVYKDQMRAITKTCKKYWWTNFLFINNLYPWNMRDECIGWVWYLANDFQFFLLTPPILFIYCKNRVAGYSTTVFLIFVSMLINTILSATYNLSPFLSTDQDYDGMTEVYEKPWTRMGAYFVGGLLGFSYFELSSKEKYPELAGTISNGIYSKLKHSRLTSLFVFLFGFGLTALYVFPMRNYFVKCGMESNCWSTFTATVYNATSRPFFVTGIALVLMPMLVGRLRFIRGLLGNEPFAVLARLNYMVYMIHCMVMLWYLNDLRQGNYVNWINQWYFSIGTMVVSFLFAVPLTLMCEVPFMNIEKYILFPPPKKSNNMVKVNGTKYEPLREDDSTFDKSTK